MKREFRTNKAKVANETSGPAASWEPRGIWEDVFWRQDFGEEREVHSRGERGRVLRGSGW